MSGAGRFPVAPSLYLVVTLLFEKRLRLFAVPHICSRIGLNAMAKQPKVIKLSYSQSNEKTGAFSMKNGPSFREWAKVLSLCLSFYRIGIFFHRFFFILTE